MVTMTWTRFVAFGILAIAGVNLAIASQVDTTTAVTGASVLAKQVSSQEWLGPLAAVAMSPFFGLACLSGAATYGPEWLQSRSALIGPSSPLNNPLLFWTMLGLTIATSLPRFTKPSKPIALAAEKLEMYSAVIILLVMRFLASPGNIETPEVTQFLGATDSIVPQAAGLASLPLDVVLGIAAAINIIVVNTIKLSIEFLVWLIPVPAIDACLEVANKTIAASMMALYAYSPLLSTILNLVIFGLCCLVFMRVQRRIRYVKDLILMPILERIFSSSPPDTKQFVGFLKNSWNGIPANTAFRFDLKNANGGASEYQLTQLSWFKRRLVLGRIESSEQKKGLMTDEVSLRTESQTVAFTVRKGLFPRPVLATAEQVT